MAAFSYQDLPLLVDCVLTPDMVMKLSSSSSVASPSTSIYPNPSFHGEQLQQSYYPFGNLSAAMAVAHSTPASSVDNEPSSVTAAKQCKRKLKGVGSSSPNSANSKDVRGGRSKKQKKCNKEESVKQEKEEDEYGRRNIEEPPKGYIHVRARRGQATDSHSLAERVRREKISERMKLLQALVPGCDKVTGKATMLDEIINYVQSLQTQVEFLSMKLASVSPIFYDFGVDLEALLLEQQGLNNMTPQAEQCSPTSGFAGGPMLESPAVFEQGQQREQANPPYLQDSIGSLYWEVEEESISQSGFCNDNNVMYC